MWCFIGGKENISTQEGIINFSKRTDKTDDNNRSECCRTDTGELRTPVYTYSEKPEREPRLGSVTSLATFGALLGFWRLFSVRSEKTGERFCSTCIKQSAHLTPSPLISLRVHSLRFSRQPTAAGGFCCKMPRSTEKRLSR